LKEAVIEIDSRFLFGAKRVFPKLRIQTFTISPGAGSRLLSN
jgi:hypothetical protein